MAKSNTELNWAIVNISLPTSVCWTSPAYLSRTFRILGQIMFRPRTFKMERRPSQFSFMHKSCVVKILMVAWIFVCVCLCVFALYATDNVTFGYKAEPSKYWGRLWLGLGNTRLRVNISIFSSRIQWFECTCTFFSVKILSSEYPNGSLDNFFGYAESNGVTFR
jgi:hypothetical protein